MEITQIQLSLVGSSSETPNNLRAYGSIVFDDCFAVHDLRIVERESGYLVAMPSQKRQRTCKSCRSKVIFSANFCCHCGKSCALAAEIADNTNLFRDIAHPITPAFRKILEDAVISNYLSGNHEKAG